MKGSQEAGGEGKDWKLAEYWVDEPIGGSK